MIESEDTMSTDDEKKEREGNGDFLSQEEVDLLRDDPMFDAFKMTTKEKPPAKKWAERVGSSK